VLNSNREPRDQKCDEINVVDHVSRVDDALVDMAYEYPKHMEMSLEVNTLEDILKYIGIKMISQDFNTFLLEWFDEERFNYCKPIDPTVWQPYPDKLKRPETQKISQYEIKCERKIQQIIEALNNPDRHRLQALEENTLTLLPSHIPHKPPVDIEDPGVPTFNTQTEYHPDQGDVAVNEGFNCSVQGGSVKFKKLKKKNTKKKRKSKFKKRKSKHKKRKSKHKKRKSKHKKRSSK